MLKADAQQAPRVKGSILAAGGIALALVLPVFLASGRGWEGLFGRGTTWARLDLLARLVLFSAPAILATLALFKRPALLVAASASTAIALPMYVFALPLLVACVLWILACDRLYPLARRWERRQLIGALLAGALVVAAGYVFYIAPSPLVCTRETRYKDGTVRYAAQVHTQPERRTQTAPYQPLANRESWEPTTCSTAFFLPERSFTVLGMLAAAFVGGFALTADRGVLGT
jgi:hypothetical protein